MAAGLDTGTTGASGTSTRIGEPLLPMPCVELDAQEVLVPAGIQRRYGGKSAEPPSSPTTGWRLAEWLLEVATLRWGARSKSARPRNTHSFDNRSRPSDARCQLDVGSTVTQRAALFLCALLLAASPSAGQETVGGRCEAFANETVLLPLDAAATLDACEDALAADPANPRLLHEYARALEATGRIEDARRLYEWAAEDGHAPAVAALQRLAVPAGGADWAVGERERVADGMAALSGALRRHLNALPPDPTDLLTVLAATGPDPDAILAWVGESTRLIPYAGSLRGPRGVLSDRSGNSLDRALLLAELLETAGQEARLARATLDPSQAEALLAATERAAAVPAISPPSPEELAVLFDDPRLPRETIAAAIDAVAATELRLARDVPERTAAIVPVLDAAIRDIAADAEARIRANALAALADHFWVQVRRGGTWVDLDPDASVIGPQVAAETFAPAGLPDELRHAVTVRVILELQTTSGRREEALLEHSWFTADRPSGAFVLSHAFSGLAAVDQLLGAARIEDRVLTVIHAESVWTPLLRSADTLVVDRLFTAAGEIREANLDAFAGIGGAIGGLFADLSGVLGGELPPPHEPAIPTAEWIEIEVHGPGVASQAQRRVIFDLVGPAARAAGTIVEIGPDLLRDRALRLTGPTDILVFAASPSDVELARVSVAAAAAVADAMRTVAVAENFPAASLVPDLPRVPVALLAFANARSAAGSPAVTAPNVVLMHDRFGWDDAGIARSTEIDIVFNAVGGGLTGRLVQGVADTALEAALADGTAANVVVIHAADIVAGRAWRPLLPADLNTVAADADLIARLRADLEAGYVVVAPADLSDPLRAGWWRIDPSTGTTLGMMPTGGGAALGEAALLIAEGAATAACFVGIGSGIAAVMGMGGSFRKGVGLCLLAAGVGAIGLGIGLGVGGMGIVAILSLAGVAAAAGIQ